MVSVSSTKYLQLLFFIKWNKLGQMQKGWYGLIFTKFEKVHRSENGVDGDHAK